MTEPQFSMTTHDDLPRTLRREKEAREREARERDAAVQAGAHYDSGYHAEGAEGYETDGASVRYLKIPFFHLMFF